MNMPGQVSRYECLLDSYLKSKEALSDDPTAKKLSEYSRNIFDMFTAQFNNYEKLLLSEKLDIETSDCWNSIEHAISCEASPWNLDKLSCTGSPPFYYPVAMCSFLQSIEFKKFCECNAESKCFSLFSQCVDEFRAMLTPYIDKLAAFSALKIIPEQHRESYLSILKMWLMESVKSNPDTPLLYPIYWQLPTGQGHFFLCKLSPTPSSNGEKIEIDIFDSTRKAEENYIYCHCSKSATTFALTKESTIAKQVCDLLELLPIYDPSSVESYIDSQSETQGEPLELRCTQVAYRVLGLGGVEIKEIGRSPLSYMSHSDGRTCTITPFRMLIYTLMRLKCEENGVEEVVEHQLKELCLAFFEIFKVYVAEKIWVSQSGGNSPENYSECAETSLKMGYCK